MGKVNRLRLLKLSSLFLLILMAGCTDSTLCHLQWYQLPTNESTWTTHDTLSIELPSSLKKASNTFAWQIEATGNTYFDYTYVQIQVGAETKDTIYWQLVKLQADSTSCTNNRKENFGRVLWKQKGKLSHIHTNTKASENNRIQRLIILPTSDTQHITDIGLCVRHLSSKR